MILVPCSTCQPKITKEMKKPTDKKGENELKLLQKTTQSCYAITDKLQCAKTTTCIWRDCDDMWPIQHEGVEKIQYVELEMLPKPTTKKDKATKVKRTKVSRKDVEAAIAAKDKKKLAEYAKTIENKVQVTTKKEEKALSALKADNLGILTIGTDGVAYAIEYSFKDDESFEAGMKKAAEDLAQSAKDMKKHSIGDYPQKKESVKQGGVEAKDKKNLKEPELELEPEPKKKKQGGTSVRRRMPWA